MDLVPRDNSVSPKRQTADETLSQKNLNQGLRTHLPVIWLEFPSEK